MKFLTLISKGGRTTLKHWHDECAVFGTWGDEEAARMTYLGLYAQQHRGQESAGIVSLHNGEHIAHRGLGLVGDVFTESSLDRLKGFASIGHVRYSTTGKNSIANIQPLRAKLSDGDIAIAHNGNIVNSENIRNTLVKEGAIFQGTNDTECLLHLLAKNPNKDRIEALKKELVKLEGAFSLVLLSQNSLIVARDPMGFRPLVLGHRNQSNGMKSYVVASETCAFDLIGATYEREVEPGELLVIDGNGIQSHRFSESEKKARCVFEHVYFSRPDSVVFGKSVYESRKKMGEILFEEDPTEGDIVIPVPDSGVPAALGYANKSGIPFEIGIIRNHYIGRTFIQPSQSIRSFGVKIKLNPQSQVLKGKRVIVIDDSIVRGTTSQKIIRMIRQAGAKEVHFRIASPPTTGACYYGVDTPESEKLIANKQSVEQIRKFIDADTLTYISNEGMLRAVEGDDKTYCSACFTGNYPTELY
ncbi:amidophosphoribosyltransferase [bacterium]|nr:amidophosphoribosyltransferase [bacterium]